MRLAMNPTGVIFTDIHAILIKDLYTLMELYFAFVLTIEKII